MAWYNNSRLYRVSVTVDNTKVDADLTDFPVYLNLADFPADFHANVKSDGGDIRITTSDETTEVAREVVFYTAASDTGEVHFKAPTLANASNTVFYVYYGNSAASDYAVSDTYGANNVWKSEYKVVAHAQVLTTDSTANANTLTNNNTVTTGTGQLSGLAGDYESGSSQYLSNSSYTIVNDSLSVSAWINPESLPSSSNLMSIVSKYQTGSGVGGFDMRLHNDAGTQKVQIALGTSTLPVATESVTLSTGTYYHLYGVYNNAGNTLKLYIDGVEVDSVAQTVGISASTRNLNIGCINYAASPGPTRFFDGLIDEVRIVHEATSADWITTEYNNQDSSSTFYSVSAQESISSTNTGNFFMFFR